MQNGSFPSEQRRSIGQFWLPEAESHVVTGVIDLEGTNVSLEVSPGLTPFHTFESIGNGKFALSVTEDREPTGIARILSEV